MAAPDDRENSSDTRFSLERRAASFGFAFAGIARLVRSQHNAWIHLAISVAVVALGCCFAITGLEWCALVLAIALVWVAEALNTALELLADAVQRDHHPLVGSAKDVAAGGVLIASIASAVVGLVVLGPYCLAFLGVRIG